ncbi:Putative NAD(P)H nitroreductase YdjA [Psychrobacter pasteurii]|uniref:Putative NAD(P)H nitroreductase n=1 Tax=Psychrobacter pasteurii TaxID=1945520 RepID=A0A1R4EFL8_9GAMM|nr:nitroreductase family protein [Psychrobacter pasteurii]SJM37305.1 Putative NAD(P)H nitroreductase YdjA [Psychrobacter pasteurii]
MTDQNFDNDLVKNTESRADSTEDNAQSTKVTDEQVINWIKSRRSIGNLTIPAPKKDQIEAAIACAMTAPDHKKLQPWRFIVTEGQKRHDFGRALLAAAKAKAQREGQELDERTVEKTLKMPLRAPMIITVVTRMQYHEKVPPFEQLLSTGAAVQNLILALKAQGFSTVWRTGPLANEPAVKSYFNVGSEDYVTAFVYVGSTHCQMPGRGEIDTTDFITYEAE